MVVSLVCGDARATADAGVSGRSVVAGAEQRLELGLALVEPLHAHSEGGEERVRRLEEVDERREELTMIAHELRNLNESLQAITYAALGAQGPQVRRRRTG